MHGFVERHWRNVTISTNTDLQCLTFSLYNGGNVTKAESFYGFVIVLVAGIFAWGGFGFRTCTKSGFVPVGSTQNSVPEKSNWCLPYLEKSGRIGYYDCLAFTTVNIYI